MTNNYREVFGITVRNARTAAALTQEQLAANANLDITSINEIENGHRNPSLNAIVSIAKALKIKPSTLFVELDNV